MLFRSSVRGLTTAASIWITAAIGILTGIGFYFPMALSVVLVLGVLSAFRWIEARMPTQAYYHFEVRFSRNGEINERQIRELVERHAFTIANFSYRLDAEGRVRRYSMTIASTDRSAAGRLAATLESAASITLPNGRCLVAVGRNGKSDALIAKPMQPNAKPKTNRIH